MAGYSFVTVWQLDAPIAAVFEAIAQSERWPEWWPGVEAVEELEKGNERGIGNVRRYTWKSRLPYRLVITTRSTRLEYPTLLEGQASGELEGIGRWQLSSERGLTTVRYAWNVQTTKAWMNLLAPVARPFFAWNHDVVMRWGGEGLARHLGARLVASGHWAQPV